MEKLLAALSLPQVGEIKTVPPDQDSEQLDGLFSIELNTRIYTLRAKSNEEAQQWVTTLNKLRQEGLLSSTQQTPLRVTNSAATNPSDASSIRTSDVAHSEWIKSGKSCFGCC